MKLKTYLAETDQSRESVAKKLKSCVNGKKGVDTSAVGRMIKRGALVIDNKIYTPQYEIDDVAKG